VIILFQIKVTANTGEVMEIVQRVDDPEILDDIMEELFAADTLAKARSIIRRAVGKSLQ